MVTRLNSSAVWFDAPRTARVSTNHEEPAQDLVVIVNGRRAEKSAITSANLWCTLWRDISPIKQTVFILSGFPWRVLRRSVFQSRRSRLCLNTLHGKLQNGNATCSFMVPGGDEVFTEARPSSQEEDIISFTIRHSGVSSWLWGRRPLFCWHIELPPSASLSLFSGPMDGALCGWLELRAIALSGDSLSCCVFTASCPRSNQIADQETSSGTEKRGWGQIDEGRFCVCTPGSDQAAAQIVTNLDL